MTGNLKLGNLSSTFQSVCVVYLRDWALMILRSIPPLDSLGALATFEYPVLRRRIWNYTKNWSYFMLILSKPYMACCFCMCACTLLAFETLSTNLKSDVFKSLEEAEHVNTHFTLQIKGSSIRECLL